MLAASNVLYDIVGILDKMFSIFLHDFMFMFHSRTDAFACTVVVYENDVIRECFALLLRR